MKSKKPPMNIVIAQSGGPTAVINASLVGALIYAKHECKGVIGKIYGARHGIQGVLNRDYIDLRKVPEAKIKRLILTPSSALGSCRLKPTVDDCRKMLKEFERLDVGFFFYIGGNDSADTARILGDEAEKAGSPLIVYHIPKTIDNDLRSCDHTPGFGSAAQFVARALKGDDLDNRALGGVKIDVIMGRDAGFLTAASALARERPDDGPHLIYLPEVPFAVETFVRDVKAVMKKYGRCVVAVSEGIRGKDGIPLGAKLADGEKDTHGNVQMSGTGALGDYLARELKAKAGIKRVRADTFGYLQRSFPAIQSPIDLTEAMCSGAAAVRAALHVASGNLAYPPTGTIGIVRSPGKKYHIDYKPLPVTKAAKYTRSVPKAYIARNGHDVTPAFLAYARPIVGKLPHTEVI